MATRSPASETYAARRLPHSLSIACAAHTQHTRGRIAHRRVARTKRNLNGGLFRPDPYDDSTVDDIAALDPRLKILQSRSEYRSEASSEMVTTSEQLFDMRDDGAVYSGAAAMG